jgi:hypothetical protein
MAIAKKAPITLYNETAEDLFVFVGDQRMFIQPYAEETFSFDVAQAFLSQHKGRVKRADDLTIGTRSAVIKPTTMWVANMTGNPELPDTLSVKVRDKKLGMTEQEIPHPAKVARPLVQKALGTWKEQSDAYGNLTSERGFAKYLKIPPYQRVEMPIATGEWFLQRCNASVFS